jgi:ABC-type uncharacterized transport system auxiliary subunit
MEIVSQIGRSTLSGPSYLKEFTATIKTSPYTFIRTSNPKEHVIGEKAMKYKFFIPALIICLEMLNACGATRPSKYYELTVPNGKSSGVDPSPIPVTLLVGPILTSHLYRDDHIVYSSSGEAMGTYEYQRWAEPPSDMISDVLLRELKDSGRYEHVYSLRSDVRGDYILRGRLFDLREIDGKTLATRVAFAFELRDSKTGTIVWSRSYSHDEPVDGKNVTAVVAAMDRNVQSGLQEIMGGLELYFSAQTQATALSR